MSVYKKNVNKPISLAGCIEIFNKAGVDKSVYSEWGIGEAFDKAEILAKEQQLTCDEIFVDIDKM